MFPPPFDDWKSTGLVNVPPGASSKTVPRPKLPSEAFQLAPPCHVVPHRFPLLSRTSPPTGFAPSGPLNSYNTLNCPVDEYLKRVPQPKWLLMLGLKSLPP